MHRRSSATTAVALLCSLCVTQLARSASLNNFIEHKSAETKAQEQRLAETEATLQAKRAASQQALSSLKAQAEAQAKLKIPKVMKGAGRLLDSHRLSFYLGGTCYIGGAALSHKGRYAARGCVVCVAWSSERLDSLGIGRANCLLCEPKLAAVEAKLASAAKLQASAENIC